MAFCTQRKFPGQSYEHNGLAEINKMKGYSSIKDHRAWSIDQNQQTSYLVDAVHKGDANAVNTQHTNRVVHCKDETKQKSKRVGTIDVGGHAPVVGTNRNDSLKMLELSMELEETKLNNTTLKNENNDLRKSIASITASEHEREQEHNMQNQLQIIENIISERNELRELLDKFLGVSDQIIELKIQTDQVKNIESDYILLQTKFRDHQTELEKLRNENKSFEERILELETTSQETNSLKETNSKLEKDLYELSNMISVSDHFIHDQENEIQTKLRTITALNKQIENLKVALSEAEMKLNKKLRLEMDVELMEKELSIMIENSSESNSYNQQVIDRQVEDLATAIKLTLGCMNYEFENDNLVEANRQLKTLLLESSNKILEFKDVINKQEQNLMKVTNDFSCTNDELTECLATVEELKRQLANRGTTRNYKPTNNDSPNVQNIAMPCRDDALIDGMDQAQEIFENEINLADSPQNSEYEDDGPGIEDLENIFEKSFIHQKHKLTSELLDLKRTTPRSEERKRECKYPDNERDVCETPDLPKLNANDEYENIQHKLNDMTSEIDNLQKVNKELRETIRMLQPPIGLKQSPSKSMSQLLNEAHREKLSTIRKSESTKDAENQNEKLKLENASLVAEISQLRNSENRAQVNIAEMEKELENLKTINEKPQQFDSALISTDVKKIENENANLKLENEKLVAEIGKLKDSGNNSQMNVLEMKKELEKLTTMNEQLSAELSEKKSEKDLALAQELDAMSPNLRDLILENEDLKKDNEKLLYKVRHLEQVDKTTPSADVLKTVNSSEQTEEVKKATTDKENKSEPDWLPSNEDLVAEIEKLQQSKNKSNLSIRQMEKDLKKLESINGDLLAQLADKEAELKQFSTRPNVDYILQRNEELKTLNENLSAEINKLKNLENVAGMKEELEKLAAANETLTAEINELKQTTDAKTLQNLKAINDSLLSEHGELMSPENSSHISILQIGKDLERLSALNESLLAPNDADVDKKHSLTHGMTPDINQLLKKNQELKNSNENLSSKIRELQHTENRAQFEAIESKKQLETLAAENERLQTQINELDAFSSNELKKENEKLRTTIDKLKDSIALLEEKLHSIENCTVAYLKTSSSNNEQQSTNNNSLPKQSGISDYSMEIDWMIADMRKLQSKNENLKATNEKLLSQISDLQSCANRSNSIDDAKTDSEKVLDNNESDSQLIYASNRNIEIEWMTADMDALHKKNEKLKNTNESLVAEIGALKSSENRSHKSIQQMERDLLKLSAMNERLSLQLNDKRLDKKHLLNARSQENVATESKDLLNKIEELTHSNECLASKITELKSLDIDKMRNDLKRLSSTNESLKLQISELKLLSSNDLKMESDWMAADMKRLLNKNKKLTMSNQNLSNDINELRREFRSLENRANMNALQKMKEMERLTSMNETLKEQLNFQKNDKKSSKSHEINLDALPSDVKKVQKKNEELKAANEKLLSVIINLKNSEKLTSSKAAESEKELKKLQETNKNLQDTLENCVEKDWSKPKTELERICQTILNEGICSLTDTELHYMYKWFSNTTLLESETAKTSRRTSNKHCRICHQAVDACDKICDCKQYEEKKRLNLLKEIEETKLAIEHIQSSNDIEFDMNDVKNRLLKGKSTDQKTNERQYEIRMSQSQGSVNVRAHIITKPAKCGNQVHQ